MHVDLHNHLVPGVDDGARTDDEAVAAIQAMRADGVRAVVPSPHVDGSITTDRERLRRRLAELDAGFARLEALISEHAPGFLAGRAAEVMLDIPAPDLSDRRLRIAGSRYVLVEFPFMRVPPNSVSALFDIRMRGHVPVVAHPERYGGLDPELELVGEWRQSGALLQVNAGSLLGRYGDRARKIAWTLLERGWATLLASDHHARGRVAVAEARRTVEGRDPAVATLLFETNPGRVVGDGEVVAVPGVAERRRWWRWGG